MATPNDVLLGAYQAAARVLSGDPGITVFFRPPAPPHKKGACWDNGQRKWIEVDPDLSTEEQYLVFLHEAAHVRSWRSVLGRAAAPGESLNKRVLFFSEPWAAGLKALARELAETNAEAQVLAWDLWVKGHAGPQACVLQRLLTLQNWR